jgi:hypothetical protein
MSQPAASYDYLPKPEVTTGDFMRDVLDQYYLRKWNPNKDTVISVKSWKDWPMIVRMPDLQKDFTVMIHEGLVQEVTNGQAPQPRILTIMLAETMQRIYYDETTSAIELIAGRIKVRGNETERRRMLAAISYLTW